MTNTTMGSLQEVQRLDERIRDLDGRLADFDARLAEVEEPALELEAELGKTAERLDQMQSDTRRLERAADDKRARAAKLEERLKHVQNLREEAAVRTELDLIGRAVEADEHEALQLLDRIRRAEIARDELAAEAAAARDRVGPDQEALLEERRGVEREVDQLRARREAALSAVSGEERRVYESFHASGRSVVVSPLLEDGACGNCFGVVPLQVQNEIRHSERLVRCEACGVILSANLDPPAPPTAAEEAAEPEEQDEADEA